MSHTLAVSNGFIVGQQIHPGGYIPHIFANQGQFQAWAQAEQPKNLVDRGIARGRAHPAIDHRNTLPSTPEPDPATAGPAPAEPEATNPGPEADVNLANLTRAINSLIDQVQTLQQRLDRLDQQPAAAAAGPATIVIQAEIISKYVDEKTGEVRLRARGGTYMKHGIPIYPENLPGLGLDPAAMEFGPAPWIKKVIVLMKKNGQPHKVLGPAE